MYNCINISYLWYNFIGCLACVLFSLMLQTALGRPTARVDAEATG